MKAEGLRENLGQSNKNFSAILIVGPTGAGKTPLGNFLESHGLQGRKCLHFDFGEQLRRFAGGTILPAGLCENDRFYVKQLLANGGLLDDDKFYIAEAFLRNFVEGTTKEKENILVLNGLPRHVQQAKRVNEILDVRMLVLLECSPEVVLRRLKENVGGDRYGRSDDRLELVREKLSVFNNETLPMIKYYRDLHINVFSIHVGTTMSAEEMAQMLPPLL